MNVSNPEPPETGSDVLDEIFLAWLAALRLRDAAAGVLGAEELQQHIERINAALSRAAWIEMRRRYGCRLVLVQSKGKGKRMGLFDKAADASHPIYQGETFITTVGGSAADAKEAASNDDAGHEERSPGKDVADEPAEAQSPADAPELNRLA